MQEIEESTSQVKRLGVERLQPPERPTRAGGSRTMANSVIRALQWEEQEEDMEEIDQFESDLWANQDVFLPLRGVDARMCIEEHLQHMLTQY